MQALLLSPATTFLSSPDSSSSLSPSTPALPSLDFLTQIDDEPPLEQDDEEDEDVTSYSRGVDTPTHGPAPSRVRAKQQQRDARPPSSDSNALERRSSIPPVPLTTPRIPSNLRYAFNAPTSSADQSTISSGYTSTSTFAPSPSHSRAQSQSIQSETEPTQTQAEEISHALIEFDQSHRAPPSASPNTSFGSSAVVGTFVVNSTRVRGPGPGGEAENDQLAAAIRAFKGPPQSAGLFGISADDADEDGQTAGQSQKAVKGNGLLSLFEPISPPTHVPLPKSTIPAPSLETFSFSPPLASSIPSSTSTPTNQAASTPSVATPSFLYDHSDSSELTPLAIPPLIPTQTPRPFSTGNMGIAAMTPSAPPQDRQTLAGETTTRGLNERKLEKRFLKRSTATTAADGAESVENVDQIEEDTAKSTTSSSNTTVRPLLPPPPPFQASAFSIADLIDSLPVHVPQPQSSNGQTFASEGGADYSTTQEFESAISHPQFALEQQSRSSEDLRAQSADWSSTEEGDDEDDRTTQEEDETEEVDGRSQGGVVPPSSMTLQQLKENGFVSSSEEEEEDDDDDAQETYLASEDGEERVGTVSIQHSAGSGRHLGYSGSSASSSEGEDMEVSQRDRFPRHRGPLQSSSNAPSSIHSSFAVPPPVPEPPTLTFDHAPPSPDQSGSNDSHRSTDDPQHDVAPLASPLKLFQSTYDTYTRHHLNKIVDLVDSTTSNHPVAREGGGDSSEEGFLGDEGRRRSCKRIKLSPPRDFDEADEDSRLLKTTAEGTFRVGQGEEEPSATEESWLRGNEDDASAENAGVSVEAGTPIRSEQSRRAARTSSERRRRTGTPRRSTGGATLSSVRRSFSVVAEGESDQEEADESRLHRHEKVKDRREEAVRLMEKIRKRSEERENRRKNDASALGEADRLRSPPKVALLSPRPRSTASKTASGSPPPLPHLAAAASASIRSVLGSPAPSYQGRSPRIASPALVPTPSKTVGLGFEKKFPSNIVAGLESGGSIGKANFAKLSIASVEREDSGIEVLEDSRPSPFLEPDPPRDSLDQPASNSTPGHKRKSSLTTIHPASSDAQRLLASAGSSARAKGMIFDQQLGRWIRTPRKRIVSRGATDRVDATVPELDEGPDEEKEEEEDEEEEDPFKDFSELQSPPQRRQSSTSIVISPPKNVQLPIPRPDAAAADVSPASTLGRADLDKLPLPGDGSGSLKLHQFDLSGLGITKGTPPLLAPPAKKALPAKSPEGACYFESHPPEAREIGETPLLRHEEEEEDSATWGGEQAERQLEQAESQRPEGHDSSPGTDSPSVPVRDTVAASQPSPATPAHSQKSQSAPPTTSTPFPRSALKPSRAQTDPTNFHSSSTPIRASSEEPKLPRSVSFSDGKLQGKIENPLIGIEPWRGSRLKYEVGKTTRAESLDLTAPAGGGFGELEMDEGLTYQAVSHQSPPDSVADDTPKASRRQAVPQEPQDVSETSVVLSSFDSISPAHPRSSNNSRSRTFSRTAGLRNATFLTECSFGVSHDRLLQYITDVEPFEPDWEGLRSIDLSGKKAESVVRLKEFLPKLDEVNLSDNEISYLTGIPPTLRTLLIASNRLTSLTSFQHLHNLERLDISHNQLDSVAHLSTLRHLRDLKADGNQISSIEGLDGLDGLIRLSLKGNQLAGEIDFSRTKWSRLENLVLSRNNLSSLRGLERLESLVTMNLDHNALDEFAPTKLNSRLRVLRICNNPMSHVDVSFCPKLRTLYVDTARLGVVEGTEQLRKLENFSLRDQSGGALVLAMPSIRDVKRLYLSGNPLPLSFPSEKFFNLTYLELAMCQLTSLPTDIANLVPNVRVLNLDFNFLDNLEPLLGLSRLAKLSVVGARLGKVRPVIHVLESLVELESLDLRMNPITLAFYPPLGPSTESLLPSHHEHQILHPDSLPASSTALNSTTLPDFTALDSKFRKALPDEWYFKRSGYRAAVMHAVPTLLKLDGIDCSRERKKLRKVVDKLNDRA